MDCIGNAGDSPSCSVQIDDTQHDVLAAAYEIIERIGKGSFGEVFRGRHRATDTTVAIKVIDLEQADDEIEDIQQEISVMAHCDSPHVTRYYSSYVVGTA